MFNAVKAYLEVVVHDSASVEVGLEEMHNTQLRAGSDVHQSLLVLDLDIGAVLICPEPPCIVEFGMELLQALLAEAVQLFVVF
jgi:hypothetical protein